MAIASPFEILWHRGTQHYCQTLDAIRLTCFRGENDMKIVNGKMLTGTIQTKKQVNTDDKLKMMFAYIYTVVFFFFVTLTTTSETVHR